MARVLAHLERGSGSRPVLLLHGFLGSGRNLASLARRWAERDAAVRLVLPDLTGHGTSPALPPGADLGTLASDVLALADALGLPSPIDVVGHSLGGRVALVLRHLAPERVGVVTLLDIAPGPIPAARNEVEGVLEALLAAPESARDRLEMRTWLDRRGVSPRLADWLLMNLAPRPDGTVGWRVDREALAALDARTHGVDLWPVLEAARTATRCARGGASRFVTDEDAARLEAAGVETATLAGAGHFVHIDAQEPLLDFIVRAS